jgi:hypothetical protein
LKREIVGFSNGVKPAEVGWIVVSFVNDVLIEVLQGQT